ncbi:cytochrome c oxidase subunit 8B, mitochondrial [Tupaia chinensis]|uniref:Cytochrome c oxidase subunit 8 n=1 Tax=Tupaia chinensis TaxID=246437 RepID=L8YCD9_TUPCH|nr:cytochrome c oxidase subunit 8B, mitochondrial [Tupaia chinensis]ELV12630.1 Cytochrome c oxidase subunit 8B, mitochondrial [Tupaia chinensis]
MLRLPTRLLQGPLRCQVVPKMHVSAKAARNPTSPTEQAVGLSLLFVSFLTPAGWVLAHLESYKKSSA